MQLRRILCVFSLGVLTAVLHLPSCQAADWPRWRGPKLNGISDEKDWSSQWPKEGPPTAWKATVGTGFAAVTVGGGRLFTAGNDDEKDTIYCLDATTGQERWKHSYDSDLGDKFFEGGPTATPTIDGDSVYALSRWGDLFCFDAATGKVRWAKNVQKEAGIRIPSWGFAGSPFVHGGLLLLNIGEAGMAVEKKTGAVAWKSENRDAGYSTAVPFQRGQESFVIFGTGKSYVAVNVRTGRELWRFPWLTSFGVNAADPILEGEFMFLSSGYDKGAALLRVNEAEPVVIWQNKEMRNQFNSSVLLNGFLYGIDGDAGSAATLKCLEFRTGLVKWSEASIGAGALMAADGKLIVFSESGTLIVAEATAERFKPISRAQVLGGKCWTVPVLANGRIYCRNAAGDLACVDVRLKKH